MGTVIDIAIGLAFVFFLVSLLASGLQEAIANLFNSRGKMLEQGISQLLNGRLETAGSFLKDTFRVTTHVAADNSPLKDSLAGQVLGHGLLDSLFRGDRLPTYIPSDKFADALIDCLRRRAGEATPTAEGLLWAVQRLPTGQPMYALETMIIASSNDVTRIRKQLIDWYEESMDRVSGWYVRAVRYRTFLIGLALAAAFQIDAVGITQTLAQNPTLRNQIVQDAMAQYKQENASAAASASNAGTQFANTLDHLTDLGLPIGWSWCAISDEHQDVNTCAAGLNFRKAVFLLIGWLIVALAVTQGAPFWFDLLGQLITVRGAGKKPTSAQKKSTTSAAGAAQPATAPPWTQSPAVSTALPADISADDMRNVQKELGVPLTAMLDAATRDAVRSWQLSHGMPVNGMVTLPVARQILSEANRARA